MPRQNRRFGRLFERFGHEPRRGRSQGRGKPARASTPIRQRVEIPVPGVVGARAVVWVEPLTAGTWRMSWYTAAPGWTGYGYTSAHDQAYPSRQAALDAGVFQMREYWARLQVPAMVIAINASFDSWELEA